LGEIADKNQSTRGRHIAFAGWMAFAAIVVVLDQLTKWAVIEWVPLYSRIPINSFLNITHQENAGAAWSFLADASGWQRWFLSALAVAVSFYITVWLWKLSESRQIVLSTGLALVLGGALGNVIDRLRLGHVIDFVQVLFGNWAFPSFNVADSAISVGAALLIIDALFLSKSTQRYEN